jgi:hypothetical protein
VIADHERIQELEQALREAAHELNEAASSFGHYGATTLVTLYRMLSKHALDAANRGAE